MYKARQKLLKYKFIMRVTIGKELKNIITYDHYHSNWTSLLIKF